MRRTTIRMKVLVDRTASVWATVRLPSSTNTIGAMLNPTRSQCQSNQLSAASAPGENQSAVTTFLHNTQNIREDSVGEPS